MAVTTKRSFCRFCHAACAIEVDVEENRVVAVRGDRLDPYFGQFTCVKGRHLGDQHHHDGRLRTSLKRTPGGGFEPIPTAQALDEIAERLRDVIAAHGPASVASYCGTATFQNAAALPVGRAFHKALGSPWFCTSITIDQPAKMVAPLRMGSWGAGWQPFSTADVSLVVGINTPVSMFGYPGGPPSVNPIVALREAKQRGWRLVVVDPRRTEMARAADLHLQVRPGEDPTLLAGMLRVILDEGRHDRAFCDRWVDGLDALHGALRRFDLDHVEARTGVAAADVVLAARMFADGPRGSATCGTGPNMAPRGTLLEHLVMTFNVVCGRFPREGELVPNPGGILGWKGPWRPPRAQVNPPNPALLASGHPSRFRDLRVVAGEAPTTALADEILAPGEGQVRALLTVGGNPLLAWPDQALALRAMRSLDLHVVLDAQLSATAKLADYVIASELSLERPDVPTTVDRWFEAPYTHYTPAVLEPEGDVVGEAFFYAELAERLGLEVKLPGGRLDLAEVTPESLLELCYPNPRVPWEVLKGTEGGALRPELSATVAPADEGATGRFQLTPEGLTTELGEVRDEEHSVGGIDGFDPEVHTHRLSSRRLKGVFNSSGREVAALREREQTSFAHVHRDDLARLGLGDGDVVELASPRGVIRAVAKVTDDVRPGTVSMAHAWGDVPGESFGDVATVGDCTGRLVDVRSGYDVHTGLPVQSAIPVQLRAPVAPAP